MKPETERSGSRARRLNFVYPLDTDLHEKLGTLYLKTKTRRSPCANSRPLSRFTPIDEAGAHYNLAMAFNAEGQKDKAREEALNALEAAPNFKPAQKLLLEVERRRHTKIKAHVNNRDPSS